VDDRRRQVASLRQERFAVHPESVKQPDIHRHAKRGETAVPSPCAALSRFFRALCVSVVSRSQALSIGIE